MINDELLYQLVTLTVGLAEAMEQVRRETPAKFERLRPDRLLAAARDVPSFRLLEDFSKDRGRVRREWDAASPEERQTWPARIRAEFEGKPQESDRKRRDLEHRLWLLEGMRVDDTVNPTRLDAAISELQQQLASLPA